MSYNLLLDTSFKKLNKHWKLTNCTYEDGYLKGNSKIYSIEQEIVLPDPTKLYFAMDYIAKDKRIKSIYIGIQTGEVLEATKKKPRFHKRHRISVVDRVKQEKVKVILIVEARTADTSIYLDAPLLVDLEVQHKVFWPKYVLNRTLDYRYGYSYENVYKESEISFENPDFTSPYTETTKAEIGIIAACKENDWFPITYNFKPGTTYLVKLDFEELNEYGTVNLVYGQTNSDVLHDQLVIVFKAEQRQGLRVLLENKEVLPYLVNLKHIMIIDLTGQTLTEGDIPHLPFI